MRKTLIALVIFNFGCAPMVTPNTGVSTGQVAESTIGGAALGAAVGTVGTAAAGGSPAAGAVGGAAAGGLLGLLSSLFTVKVVHTYGQNYYGGYSGRSYDPKEFCQSYDTADERERCERKYREGAEEGLLQADREIKDEARQIAADAVRDSGRLPEEYCTQFSLDRQRKSCKEGLREGGSEGWRLRQSDIDDEAWRAGRSSAW